MKREELQRYLELSISESMRGESSVIILDTDNQVLVDELFASLAGDGSNRIPEAIFVRRTTDILAVPSSTLFLY